MGFLFRVFSGYFFQGFSEFFDVFALDGGVMEFSENYAVTHNGLTEISISRHFSSLVIFKS